MQAWALEEISEAKGWGVVIDDAALLPAFFKKVDMELV